MKLNLGCGKQILDGYINVDIDSEDADVNEDLLDYLFAAQRESVSEILMDQVLEHLEFKKEKDFFVLAQRALVPGGKLIIRVPDFEWLCRKFIEADENGFEWYEMGSQDHYFGGGHDVTKRWSYLVASFYGHQNGLGEFHKNAYTKQKFWEITRYMQLDVVETKSFMRKTVQCIEAVIKKKD